MLPGQGMLKVPERRLRWRVRRRSLESLAGLAASLGIVVAKSGEPALRFPLEVLEGTVRREFPDHDLPPVTARRPLSDGLEEGSSVLLEPNGWE